jgi:D-alanine transaminase
MVFLNGEFLEQEEAKISTLDRGFLFGDGVYEVIPVYNHKIFGLTEHLQRLSKSLEATKIPNPLKTQEYRQIFNKLLRQSSANNTNNQTIYLQITRGVGVKRSHNFENLTPTIYIRTDPLNEKNFDDLKQGFKAIIQKDIRWDNCHIKSTSLLANVLYTTVASENGAEEVILEKNGVITEGASSNVFILKDEKVITPKLSNNILAGITRDMVIKSCELAGIEVIEKDISKNELLQSDEVWISSSTREIMPISQIDDKNFQLAGSIWQQIYDKFQTLKLQ